MFRLHGKVLARAGLKLNLWAFLPAVSGGMFCSAVETPRSLSFWRCRRAPSSIHSPKTSRQATANIGMLMLFASVVSRRRTGDWFKSPHVCSGSLRMFKPQTAASFGNVSLQLAGVEGVRVSAGITCVEAALG